jgi:hypothetical protein
LLALHAWNAAAVGWWNSSTVDVVDVVRDYGATPDWVDDADDDGKADLDVVVAKLEVAA